MKITKVTLIASVLVIAMCATALVGSTLAWFNDTEETGVNTIVAGNLDAELLHTNNAVTDETVGEGTILFTGKGNKPIKWEPGAVSYEIFTVKNIGSVAFKYDLSMNIGKYNTFTADSEAHSLKEPLKVKVLEGDKIITNISRMDVAAMDWSTAEALDDFKKEGRFLYPVGNTDGGKSEEKFQVIVYWVPTENDNLWNVKDGKKTDDDKEELSIEFGIKLVANQLTYEEDSFDKEYDKDAPKISASFTPVETGSDNDDMKIENQGDVKEATVPGADVDNLFNELKDGEADSNSMTLKLDVEKTNESEDAVAFNIDMTAVMTSRKDGETTTNEKKVENLNDFVEIKVDVGAGRLISTAKHNGNVMTKVDNRSAIGAGGNPYGYFAYDKDSGIATIWTKDFSPFSFEFEKLMTDAELLEKFPHATCRIDNTGYDRPFSENVKDKKDSALKAAKSGDTIKMIKDYITSNSQLAIVKDNDFVVTIDLNGKKIENTSRSIQLDVGTYNIVDKEGTGKFSKFDMYNNQGRLNTITVNVYGGTFDKIATDGDHGDKTLNIYGGTIGLVEVQGSEQYGHEGTSDIRAAVDKVVVNGGEIGKISFYNTVAGVLTANVPMQLHEITGQEKINYYGSEFMANAYRLYTVSKQTN